MPGKMTEETALAEENKIKSEVDIMSAVIAYAKENKNKKIKKGDSITVGSTTMCVPYTVVIDEAGNPYARYDRDKVHAVEGFFAGQGAMGQAEYVFALGNKTRVIMKTQALTKEVVNDPGKCPDFIGKWADFLAVSEENDTVQGKNTLVIEYIKEKNEKIAQEIELSKDVGLSLGKCVISTGDNSFEAFEFQKPSGISLLKAFNELEFSMEDKLDIMISAFENLQLIHEKGIWHGDIQPANILVMKDPETGKFKATIIDFGEAIRSAPDTVRTDEKRADLKHFAFEFEKFFNGLIQIDHLKDTIDSKFKPQLQQLETELENIRNTEIKENNEQIDLIEKEMGLIEKKIVLIEEKIGSIRENVEKDKSDPKYQNVNAIIQKISTCGHSSLSGNAKTALHNMRVIRAMEDVVMAIEAVKNQVPGQTHEQLQENLEKAKDVLYSLNEAERERVLNIAKTPEPVQAKSLMQRIMSTINLKPQTRKLTEQPPSRPFVRKKEGGKLVDLGKRKNSGPDPDPDPGPKREKP